MNQETLETQEIDLIPKSIYRNFVEKDGKAEEIIELGPDNYDSSGRRTVPAWRLISIKCFIVLLTFILLAMTLVSNLILDLTSNTALLNSLEKFINLKIANKSLI